MIADRPFDPTGGGDVRRSGAIDAAAARPRRDARASRRARSAGSTRPVGSTRPAPASRRGRRVAGRRRRPRSSCGRARDGQRRATRESGWRRRRRRRSVGPDTMWVPAWVPDGFSSGTSVRRHGDPSTQRPPASGPRSSCFESSTGEAALLARSSRRPRPAPRRRYRAHGARDHGLVDAGGRGAGPTDRPSSQWTEGEVDVHAMRATSPTTAVVALLDRLTLRRPGDPLGRVRRRRGAGPSATSLRSRRAPAPRAFSLRPVVCPTGTAEPRCRSRPTPPATATRVPDAVIAGRVDDDGVPSAHDRRSGRATPADPTTWPSGPTAGRRWCTAREVLDEATAERIALAVRPVVARRGAGVERRGRAIGSAPGGARRGRPPRRPGRGDRHVGADRASA